MSWATEVPAFYQCGICDAMHEQSFDGDCRDDAARYYPDQLDDRFGPFGWIEVDMEDE